MFPPGGHPESIRWSLCEGIEGEDSAAVRRDATAEDRRVFGLPRPPSPGASPIGPEGIPNRSDGRFARELKEKIAQQCAVMRPPRIAASSGCPVPGRRVPSTTKTFIYRRQ